MAKLSKQEQSLLEKLQAKLDSPDTGPIGRTINATIDLADPKQIALAIKHGFLDPDELEEEESAEEEADEKPRRQGYFKD